MGRSIKQNSLTSPELLAQVNPKNKELKQDFINYMKSIKRSEGTIKGYSHDLDTFFCWVLQNAKNKSFTEITKRDIIAYQTWLIEENENSPARVRRLKSAISSLSNFVSDILADEDEEYEGFHSIVRKIANPPLQATQEKTVWTDEELQSLLDTLVERKEYEKACFLALAIYSGRRKAELLRFRVSDFDEDKLTCEGALYKSQPILTKGAKYLECYVLAKRFKPYLDMWMDERKASGIESEWLFPDPNDPSKQRGTVSLNSWSKSFSLITGKDFYFHSCRHRFVTMLSQSGLPDSVVIQIIGWSDTSGGAMFSIYNDTPKDDQIAAYFKGGDIFIPDSKGFGDV